MATFVLVHGAWRGAWCRRRVAWRLIQNGHEVFTPTLTGIAERSHLLTPDINLDTHILDVVNEMKWQELNNVVLVGHSYAGIGYESSFGQYRHEDSQPRTLGLLEHLREECKGLWGASSEAYFRVEKLLRQHPDANAVSR